MTSTEHSSRRGTRVYLPKVTIIDSVERIVRPLVEKSYSHHLETNEVQTVAGFQVGLRELTVGIDLSLEQYELSFVDLEDKKGKIVFVIENQVIKGQAVMHIDRDIELIVKLGSLVNKDYIIDFDFKLNKLILEVEIDIGEDNVPQIKLEVKLEDLNLAENLNFEIKNSDLISDLVSYLKGFWMPIVETILMKELFPKLNTEVADKINGEIRSKYERKVKVDDKLHLEIDITVHEFSIHAEHIVVTIDGHFNNYDNRRNMDEVAYATYDMPGLDLSLLQKGELAFQMSDDNIYTLVYAILQNKMNFEMDIDKSVCNSITVQREPNYSAVIAILRDTDENDGKPTGLHISAELFLKITINLVAVPNFDLKVKVKSELVDIGILGDKGTDDAFFLNLSVINTIVLDLYDDKMNTLVGLHHNNTIYNKIRDKMASSKITQEIAVNKIKVGDNCGFHATKIMPFDGFMAMVGVLKFED